MASLYEVTGDVLQLQQMLEDSIEDDQCLIDTLEAVDGDYEVKLESYCKVIRNLEAVIEARKAEAKRLTDGAKVLEGNIDRLKRSMFESMKAIGKTKIKGTLFNISIQKNGGKVPVIWDSEITDTSKLPDDLVIVTEKPNLDAIREQLEVGKFIEGFTLGERGESLRIK